VREKGRPAAGDHEPETKDGLDQQPSSSEIAARKQGGARHRRKGDRCEREIVALHRALGVHAERYPLSGASRFRGAGHDLDLYLFGGDEAQAVFECKARKSGIGFTMLERWLGEYDALFLRRDHSDPLILLAWRVWARLLERVRR
jgi:hypothetical protein